MAKFKVTGVKGQRKIIGWATSKNGKHYPIFEDYKKGKSYTEEEQGKSTRKEVKNKIQQHILEHFTEDYGYDGDQEEAFVKQMEAMGENNIWNAGKKFAEGGSLLVYTGDMRNFLDGLNINPKGKKFSDEKVFETYTNLVGREAQDLYNTIQKRKAMGESKYKVISSKKAELGEGNPTKSDVIRFKMGQGMSKELIKSYIKDKTTASKKNKVISADDTGSKLLKMAQDIRSGKLDKDKYIEWDDDVYSVGEDAKKGYYVQFQDRTTNRYDDINKYPNASPRVSTYTMARVWKDGENVYNNNYDKDAKATSKYGARKAVADYLENVALLNTNQLVKSYIDRGYSRETAEKMAKEAIKHRLKKRK